MSLLGNEKFFDNVDFLKYKNNFKPVFCFRTSERVPGRKLLISLTFQIFYLGKLLDH